jgi:hypothetical protein
MRRKWILMIPIGIAAITLFVFIGGTAVQLLWNWLLPPLFGWKELTFWQALGMLALCRILFGGVGGRGGGGGRWHRNNMSPEEREKFRARMRERWGWQRPQPESPQDQA